MSNDFGIKVSLPGFNAETAADQNLYFSSSWPSLKIDDALSGTMTLQGDPSLDVITHNLNYPPFPLIFSKANGFAPGYINSIDSSTVNIAGPKGDEIQYYITRNPLNINFLAPNISLAEVQQGTNHQDFGIKFTKPGKESISTDLRDYTIHSGTKSLQVHQVIYQPLGQFNDTVLGVPNFPDNMGIKYITDLPYNPVYFAFFSSDNENFIPLFAISQSTPKIEYNSIDGGIIIYNGTSPGWGVFYIMLDPYQSSNQISITL